MNFVMLGTVLINMAHVCAIRDRSTDQKDSIEVYFIGGHIEILMTYEEAKREIKAKTGLNF